MISIYKCYAEFQLTKTYKTNIYTLCDMLLPCPASRAVAKLVFSSDAKNIFLLNINNCFLLHVRAVFVLIVKNIYNIIICLTSNNMTMFEWQSLYCIMYR